MSRKQSEYSWDKYVEEAKGEPFILNTNGEKLVFEMPSGIALIQVAKGHRAGDPELILYAVAGEQWDKLRELLGSAGHRAMKDLVDDMMDHFDLYEDVKLVSPNGDKTLTRRRPREIQVMLEQGWRPAGEAPASSR